MLYPKFLECWRHCLFRCTNASVNPAFLGVIVLSSVISVFARPGKILTREKMCGLARYLPGGRILRLIPNLRDNEKVLSGLLK
jgi:hypothetical protein